MANNELSGPAVIYGLLKYIKFKNLKYTYRFVMLQRQLGLFLIYQNIIKK